MQCCHGSSRVGHLNESKCVIQHTGDVLSGSVCTAKQFQSRELPKVQSVHSCVNAEKIGDGGVLATLKVQNLVFQPVLKVCRINKAYTVDDVGDAGSF